MKLVWCRSTGNLLLPPLPPGLTPEERAGFDQDRKDLSKGLAKKSMPVKTQAFYGKQVLLQEEELLEMYATSTAQPWALEGGGDTNQKKIWTYTDKQRKGFIDHYPSGAVAEIKNRIGAGLGGAAAGSSSSSIDEPAHKFIYPDIHEPGLAPVLHPKELIEAKPQVVLMSANFQRGNLPLHIDSGVAAEGHGTHIATLTMGHEGVVILHSLVTHRTYYFKVQPGDLWGMKEPLVAHLEWEGEEQVLAHRWLIAGSTQSGPSTAPRNNRTCAANHLTTAIRRLDRLTPR